MMKSVFCIAFTLAVLTTMQACNDNRKAKNYNELTQVDETGMNLIKLGIESGNAEIGLSKLAIKNSQNQKIVNFANMMITDHTALGNQLKTLGTNKKVNLPDSLTIEHKQLITTLSGKTGAEFDKDYIEAMVADHEKAVELFKEASHNTDKSVDQLATASIPKLQAHLQEAEKIKASLK